MLKILQAKLQQYVNRELPDVQAGIRKGRKTRDQIANISWIIEKAREFQENIYFCFIVASLVAQLVKNPPAMQETWVRSQGWEDPLGSLPTPVFCPGKFHVLYRPWGCKESDMTERLSLSA